MSEEDVRDTMTKLTALSACFNVVMEQFEALEAARITDDEPPELRQLALSLEAHRLGMEFFKVCDPPSAGRIDTLFRPVQHLVIDKLARRRSRRKDGQQANVAEYVLTGFIWKAILAAAADLLICSKLSRACTAKWLPGHLSGFKPAISATAVIDCRDEIRARMAQPQRADKPLDIMVTIFRWYRPTREGMDQADAKRLAEHWIKEARLNVVPTIST
jgi:hypothetical protein